MLQVQLSASAAESLLVGKFKIKAAGSGNDATEIDSVWLYRDLNGDGAEDAAVVLATSGGGSGTFISLEAVLNDKGKPKHVASTLLGDRAQIKSVVIESGEITVNMVTHGPDDPMCCPTQEVTEQYKLQGDTLVQTPS